MALRTDQGLVVEPEWLPDDTEEDLVGSSLHQLAITTLYDSLRLVGPERDLPWCVGDQLTLVIPRPNGSLYRPSPDILVHPTAGEADRTEFDTRVEGVPSLIAEVVSPTTWQRDVDRKAAWYAYAGVREYFVFDPTGDQLGAHVWARRLIGRRFAPWPTESDGRWTSTTLGITFDVQGPLVRVYDQQGALVPTVTEQARRLAERDRRLAEQDRQLAERDQRLAEQQREVARLQEELRRLRGTDETAHG